MKTLIPTFEEREYRLTDSVKVKTFPSFTESGKLVVVLFGESGTGLWPCQSGVISLPTRIYINETYPRMEVNPYQLSEFEMEHVAGREINEACGRPGETKIPDIIKVLGV